MHKQIITVNDNNLEYRLCPGLAFSIVTNYFSPRLFPNFGPGLQLVRWCSLELRDHLLWNPGSARTSRPTKQSYLYVMQEQYYKHTHDVVKLSKQINTHMGNRL